MSEVAEFANGAAELKKAQSLRGRTGNLRAAGGGVVGVSYGLSAYGSPIGAVTGIQQPTSAPAVPLGEQWGGGMTGGDSGGGAVGAVGGDGGGGGMGSA